MGDVNILNAEIWMQEARQHIGLREIKGPKHNATILKWLHQLKAWWADDETPWCGVFVAQCISAAGLPLPRYWMRAKDWLNWGVTLPGPAYGAIVVFGREGGGHVGFLAGFDNKGRPMILGGNQGNAVSIAPFDHTRILGYRWPKGIEIRYDAIPILSTDMDSSTNEA